MKRVLSILGVLVITVGLATGFGGMKTFSSSSPESKDAQPAFDREVSNNDDAFDDYHDTFDMEGLANNDDAFDDYDDTFNMEELANNDDAFDDYHDTFDMEGLC